MARIVVEETDDGGNLRRFKVTVGKATEELVLGETFQPPLPEVGEEAPPFRLFGSRRRPLFGKPRRKCKGVKLFTRSVLGGAPGLKSQK